MKADNICKLELIYIEIHCLLCNVLLSLLYIFFCCLRVPGHVTFGVRCHPRKPPRQYEPNLHRTKFNLNPLFGHFSATTEPFERKLAWHIPCFVNLVATE